MEMTIQRKEWDMMLKWFGIVQYLAEYKIPENGKCFCCGYNHNLFNSHYAACIINISRELVKDREIQKLWHDKKICCGHPLSISKTEPSFYYCDMCNKIDKNGPKPPKLEDVLFCASCGKPSTNHPYRHPFISRKPV